MKEDAALVKKMTANRDARLKEVDKAIAEAKEMEGDTEVNYPLPCVPGRWKEREKEILPVNVERCTTSDLPFCYRGGASIALSILCNIELNGDVR